MSTILKKNRFFFIGFLLFIFIGGILLYQYEQGHFILFFSENRSQAGDLFFRYFTKFGEEYAYFFFIFILLFVRFRYALLVPLTGVLVAFMSLWLKAMFSHDRPLPYFIRKGMVDQINFVEEVELLNGATSFPSGHTMSAFALYGLIALIFSKNQKLGVLLFCIAVLVSISRIYLVQHFLKDIYLGAIFGVLIALILFIIQNRFPYNPKNWLDRSFLYKKKSEHLELHHQKSGQLKP